MDCGATIPREVMLSIQENSARMRHWFSLLLKKAKKQSPKAKAKKQKPESATLVGLNRDSMLSTL
jgi:hypothetical protein